SYNPFKAGTPWSRSVLVAGRVSQLFSSGSDLMPYRDDMPTLSEFDGIRYLHFGTKWVQGAMRISRPNQLVLDYTRQMMAWLLFTDPQPTDTIGILGLGAGALLKYTLAHTPAQVETVEWNDEVTAICRAYFRLPDSPRSTIFTPMPPSGWPSPPISDVARPCWLTCTMPMPRVRCV